MTPTLYWIRRDLRLADNPALSHALSANGSVIPVFVRDTETDALPAAPKWRLGLGLGRLQKSLADKGSRLIFRSGPALDVLLALAAETGAKHIVWNRLYDPVARARDTQVKQDLIATGLTAQSYNGHLLHEPWTVETATGGFYKVYTPFWKALRTRDVAAPLPSPNHIPPPQTWPNSETLADWNMGQAMQRGADIVRPHLILGEQAALDRLSTFLRDPINHYETARNLLAKDGTSGLSENLSTGEISPRTVWQAGRKAMERGAAGAETFLKEIVWREFAYHLLYHTPHITTQNWKPEWDAFPWADSGQQLTAWQQARTGMPIVDAGLRQMYVTGKMHNRARMLVASYLTKHLLTHWYVGCDWFAHCLVDWDPASNAMGWQWAAGSGPDAAPYFRVFNPETQAEKFDPSGTYRRRWVAELSARPPQSALDYFQAIPKSWAMTPNDPYPNAPIVGAKEGRVKALEAYEKRAWAKS